MKLVFASVVAMCALVAVTSASPQNAPVTNGTDMYHVLFLKAAPGQAAALGKALIVPDKTNAMPDHFVVLRHQEGDVIEPVDGGVRNHDRMVVAVAAHEGHGFGAVRQAKSERAFIECG